MPGTFHLSVVTPEREILALEARFVAFPAYDGEMGILAHRAPLLTKLGAGMLRVEEASGAKRALFVAGGFAQMVGDKLTLLTEEAIEPDKLSAEGGEADLAAAARLPNVTDAENELREAARVRILARLRALTREQGRGQMKH
jgi:F-type H+-transporting ATPase subunit epsilon